MSKPAYTSVADQDLLDILNYISRDKPGAALAWVEKIEARCLVIADNTTIGDARPDLGQGVRATAVGRYVIYHRQSGGEVEILRVIPGDRDVRRL